MRTSTTPVGCYLLLLVVCLGSAGSVKADEGIDAAMAAARVTGQPVLAIAGRQNCPLCQALKERLQDEQSLRPLLVNFVPLQIDVDGPAFQEWAQKYPVEGNGLPFVYVVRADGQMLHSSSGLPQGNQLPALLGNSLEQAGAPLDPRIVEKLNRGIATAETAIAAGEISEAIAALSPVIVPNSFAGNARKAKELMQSLIDQGQAAVAEAETELADQETALLGAVKLVEVQRVYRRLPEIAKAAGELKREQRDPEIKALFAQASMIDKARVMESKDQNERAVDAYHEVIAKYPDTSAAEYAQARIDAIEAAQQ